MSAGVSPTKSSGRRKSGPTAQAVPPKSSSHDAAALRRRRAAAAASETESESSGQQVEHAAVRKSSRVLARKLKQPAQASRFRPDSESPAEDDALDMPAEEVRRKPDAAARSAGRVEQAAAAALTRLSEETESDDAVQRHRARLSERGQATELASRAPQAKLQQANGRSAGAAGAPSANARRSSGTAKRPGKMRSLADLTGTAPGQPAAPQSERQPSGSGPGGVKGAANSNGRAAMHNADAGAVNTGRSEPHANGGSARAGTPVEQPDSEDWTDAQVCLGVWCQQSYYRGPRQITNCFALLSLTQLSVAGVGSEICTVQPQPNRQAVLDVGCG